MKLWANLVFQEYGGKKWKLIEKIKELNKLSGEINLHYMYPMISRPNGRSVVLIRLDDLELGVEILDKRGFTTIGHGELMDHTDETESGAW